MSAAFISNFGLLLLPEAGKGRARFPQCARPILFVLRGERS